MCNKNKRPLLKMILFSLVAFSLCLFDPLYRYNRAAQDFLFQALPNTGPVPGNTVSIGIDDSDMSAFGPGNFWAGDEMAQLIGKLNSDSHNRPAVIGIDCFYSSHSMLGSEAFVKAAHEADNIVLVSHLKYDWTYLHLFGKVRRAESFIVEAEAPHRALEGIPSGFSNVFTDRDSISRHSLLRAEMGGETLESFPFLLYQKYLERTGGGEPQLPPMDKESRWYVPYTYSPHNFLLAKYSFGKLLAADELPHSFKDAVVIIGFNDVNYAECAFTPLDKTTHMLEPEINANIVQALISQNHKREAPRAIQATVAFAVFLVCYGLLHLRKVKRPGIVLLAATAGYVALAMLLYRVGVVVDIIYIPLYGCIIYASSVLQKYFFQQKQNYLLENTFKRYVPPALVDDLLKSRSNFTELGGEKREIAVLFIDIRGFTDLSESLPPEDIIAILNWYFEFVISCIFAHGGTVDKFIGDGVMAVFNAPFDQEDYLYQCVSSALDVALRAKEWAANIQARYGRTLWLGMGINCGEGIVGNIGAQSRMDYTAIGDTVNIAARLEGIAQAGQILMSGSALAKLEGRVSVRDKGEVALKGKSAKSHVYELLGKA